MNTTLGLTNGWFGLGGAVAPNSGWSAKPVWPVSGGPMSGPFGTPWWMGQAAAPGALFFNPWAAFAAPQQSLFGSMMAPWTGAAPWSGATAWGWPAWPLAAMGNMFGGNMFGGNMFGMGQQPQSLASWPMQFFTGGGLFPGANRPASPFALAWPWTAFGSSQPGFGNSQPGVWPGVWGNVVMPWNLLPSSTGAASAPADPFGVQQLMNAWMALLPSTASVPATTSTSRATTSTARSTASASHSPATPLEQVWPWLAWWR